MPDAQDVAVPAPAVLTPQAAAAGEAVAGERGAEVGMGDVLRVPRAPEPALQMPLFGFGLAFGTGGAVAPVLSDLRSSGGSGGMDGRGRGKGRRKMYVERLRRADSGYVSGE